MDAAGDHGPILVVDDDAALAEMLQLVLIKEGFSTAGVGHGSDVMDVFREHRPALVLLDLMLPGVTVSGSVRTSDVSQASRSSCSLPALTPLMSSKDLVLEPTTTSVSRSGPPSSLLVFVPGCAHPFPGVRRARSLPSGI